MATIAINLDDQANDGLERLTETLGRTDQATSGLGATISETSDEQLRQIDIIHKHQESLGRLGVEANESAASVTSKLVDLSAVMVPIYERQRMIAAGHRLVTTAINGSTVALESQGLRYKILRESGEFAIKRVVGYLTGLGIAIAAADAAWKSFDLVMSHTGKRADELGNITTNMDRIRTATSDVVNDVKLGFQTLREETWEWIRAIDLVPTPIRKIGQAVDSSVTASTEQIVENINALREFVDFGDTDLKRVHASLETQRETEKLGFEAIREANERLRGSESKRAEAESIANIKSIAQLEEKLAAIRTMAAEMAKEGVHTERVVKGPDGKETTEKVSVAGEFLYEKVEALERRRSEIVKEESTRRDEIRREESTRFNELEESFQRRHFERLKAREKEIEDHNKRVRELHDEANNFRVDAEIASVNEIFSTSIARMKSEGADFASLHNAKLKQIEAETRLKTAAAKTDMDRLRAYHDGERSRMRETAEYNRNMEIKKVEDRKAAIKAKEDAEREHKNRLDQLMSGSGINGAAILGSVDPRRAFAAFRRRRVSAALQEFDAGHSASDEETSEGRARLNAQRRAVFRDTSRQAFRDFRRGDQEFSEERSNAQLEAARGSIRAMERSGQLSSEVVQALEQAARLAAEQQASTAQLQQQVNRINQFLGTSANRARQQRHQAQAGSN